MTQEWYQPLPDERATSLEHKAKSAAPPTEPKPSPLLPPPKPLKPFTLLLVGVDSRKGERARSDTVMLAAVHPAKQRVHLLSIPRDTYLLLPGRGHDKVNHAMAYGGPALLKKTLEQFIHLSIDRYIVVDFEGFRQIIDQMGGVQLAVSKRMRYTDPTDGTRIDLKPGLQVLNGKQALDYARYRKSDTGPEDSDYERIARQQEILHALAAKGSSLQGMARAVRLMEILGDHVKTDLTEAEIASLLLTYSDSEGNVLLTETLKGRDTRIWRNGILGWYYLVSEAEQQRVREWFLRELATNTSP
ncbi:MAG: LCP family protein [Brevibacillus sp.]|nr:LCP family protein [Brevibacillus sp.]